MLDLDKNEIEVLFTFMRRSLKYFVDNNYERKFWNDAYNIDELETIMKKVDNAKVHL